MKKLMVLLLVFAMVFGLFACGNGDSDQTKNTENQEQNGGSNNSGDTDDRVALDVFSGLTVKFNSAINGFGKSCKLEFDYKKVDYDKTNADIEVFLKDVEFFTDELSDLSNGDSVTVYARWSKATAEALGVKLKEETKEYQVSGLYDVYRKASDVPAGLTEIEEIQAKIEDSYRNWAEDRYWIDDEPDSIDYHYYYVYTNDAAGNPYISKIYISAAITAGCTSDDSDNPSIEHSDEATVGFLGYNYLYQSYWEMRATPFADRSDDVSDNGEWNGKGDFVKVEEFFL